MGKTRSQGDLVADNRLGVGTDSIGIGTTNPTANLDVRGDAKIGVLEVGIGNTDVIVTGDMRVTGILTVGSSSLTLDGTNNVVNVGTALTLGHTQGVQFHTQNLHSDGFEVNNINASGVITATSFVGDGANLTGLQAGYFEKTDAGINTSTNIGIGTTNPTSALTVSGDANVTGVITATSFVGNFTGDATGLSGSPSITVTDITASGNVSIAGTLTYEDVTNVDSVGLITARNGVDVTGNITVTGTVDGRDVATDGSKLDGIESGATADQTASEILTSIKTVDGTGSGLDADTVDGIQGASFLRSDASDSYTGSQLTFTTTGVGCMHYGGEGWQVSSSDAAYQRADARDDGTNYSRLHWYGVSDSGATSNFRHAYYDGAAYINVTSSSSNLNFQRTTGTASLQVHGNTVWHAGNDGSGSGLDADTVDGIQASNFVRSDVDDTKSGQLAITGSGQYVGNYGYSTLVLQDTSGYPGIDFRYGTKDWLQRMEAGTSMQWVYRDNGNHTERMELTTAGVLTVNGNTVWHAGNDGSGSGLDADLLDGQDSSYYRNASNLNAGTFPDLFSSGTRYNIGYIDGHNGDNYDKLRVYNSSSYTIGMKSAQTFGWLNDWAMTFTFNNESDRGFLWRDTSDTAAQGAMSLTTNGNLCVANVIAVGGQTTRYLQEPTGNYGSIQITGSGYSNWEGFSIDGRVVFMHDGGSGAGIYNDVDNEWFFYAVRNSYTRMYHNGSTCIETSGSSSATIGGNNIWHAGNDGSGSGLDADNLDGYTWTSGTNATFSRIEFTGVGGNSGNGVHNYAIYQEGGAWSNPYPDLVIGYHTGVKIGGHTSYNGTRFYSDAPGRSGATELFSVGNGDNHVRVQNDLLVYGNARLHDDDQLHFGTSVVSGGNYPIRAYYSSSETLSRVRMSRDVIFDFEIDSDVIMRFHRDTAANGCVIFGNYSNNNSYVSAKIYCPDACYIGGLRVHNGRTSLPDGYRNSIVGDSARTFGTANGSDNTCIGYASGRDMSTGVYNTQLGSNCQRKVTSGSYGTYVGANAGYNKTTGNYCTAIGYNADYYLQNGNSNTTYGYTNTTCLGYDSRISGSNQLQLGNSSVTSYAYGSVQNRSDARDKTDIRDTILGLDFIKRLRPVDFRWDYRDDYYDLVVAEDVVDDVDPENIHPQHKLEPVAKDGSRARTRFHHGLIAQDVKETMDEMGIDFAGYQDHSIKDGLDVLSIGYTELIGPMIKAIQEQQAQIEALTAEIQALKNS
jgi:hypothetical protein